MNSYGAGRPKVQQSTSKKRAMFRSDESYRKYLDKEHDRKKARYEPRRDWFMDVKSSIGCQSCGETYPQSLDFHHIDRASKTFVVSLMNIMRAEASFIAELGKCTLLCSSCHRKLHHGDIELNVPPIDVSALPPMPR